MRLPAVLLAVLLALLLAEQPVEAVTLELNPLSCPPPVALRKCSPTCQHDEECPGEKLCCATNCGGTACVRGVTATRGLGLGLHGGGGGKQGKCPAVEEGEWQCSSTCRGDFDCSGESKCCRTRCGAQSCTLPRYTL